MSNPSIPGVTEVTEPKSDYIHAAALDSDGNVGLLGNFGNYGCVLD